MVLLVVCGPRDVAGPVASRPPTLGPIVLPAVHDVLEVTLGPAAQVVPLDGVRVVRTTARPDHPAGNALHLSSPLTSATVDAARRQLDERFPTGRARIVAPLGPDGVPDPAGLRPSVLHVLRYAGGGDRGRPDLDIGPPRDDRAWHGLTVLHRHAAPPGEDRARGAADDRLRWWVDGVRTLATQGRARVLRAVRFGTPVAAGVLYWAPGAAVPAGQAGLAVVADLVVHPAHRGLGIGRAVTSQLVADHLADFPQAAVTGLWELAGSSPPAPSPSGWEQLAALAALTRVDDGPDRARR